VKQLLLYGFIPLFAWQTCGVKDSSSPATENKAAGLIKDTINFSNQVHPIMVKNCSPCHFPGGKMYERMPFDQDTTILNHEAGILKRIKKEEENLIINTFILQNKNGSSGDKPH
jgi:hypothetical protein